MAEKIILSDPFYLCSSTKNYNGQECRVILSQTCLAIQASSDVSAVKNREIPIENLIGCLCMKNSDSSNQGNANSVFLSVYFYSLAKNFKKNQYRKRGSILFRSCKYSSFEENCNVISQYVFKNYLEKYN